MTTSVTCGKRICSSVSGLSGIDTDIVRDDDRYLANKLKEIDFPDWNDPARAPCHTPMPASNKIVLQYPPGTGFVLAAVSRRVSGDSALRAGLARRRAVFVRSP